MCFALLRLAFEISNSSRVRDDVFLATRLSQPATAKARCRRLSVSTITFGGVAGWTRVAVASEGYASAARSHVAGVRCFPQHKAPKA